MGRNQLKDLPLIEPRTMAAGATVDLDLARLGVARHAKSPPTARAATPAGGRPLCDGLLKTGETLAIDPGSPANGFKFPSIQPGAVAGETMIDLDSVEFEGRHRFPA